VTITREQVADLRPGDVVEISDVHWPNGTVVRGPLWLDGDTLHCAGEYVRHHDGSAPAGGATQTLTVVSRAPRPLYVNHDRTEPVPGDVVRDADGTGNDVWFRYEFNSGGAGWCNLRTQLRNRSELPDSLLLLVDGTTGLPAAPMQGDPR
jgi:hypothetical protein